MQGLFHRVARIITLNPNFTITIKLVHFYMLLSLSTEGSTQVFVRRDCGNPPKLQ
jgi:hypothetical protein